FHRHLGAAPAATVIYPLSLHDALPICDGEYKVAVLARPTSDLRGLGEADGIEVVHGDLGDAPSLDRAASGVDVVFHSAARVDERSEEHTSELQSRGHLVCRLLLEKKNK